MLNVVLLILSTISSYDLRFKALYCRSFITRMSAPLSGSMWTITSFITIGTVFSKSVDLDFVNRLVSQNLPQRLSLGLRHYLRYPKLTRLKLASHLSVSYVKVFGVFSSLGLQLIHKL